MSRLHPFGFLFEKSLNDLIREIRARKDPETLQEYLRLVVAECREEVRAPSLDVKTVAVLKLAYLEMLGFDMSWAGFHVLEVMASPRFQQKRIGYLAAMQSFRGDPELLVLATNMLKTDLASSSRSQVGVALSGLATIVTPLLAADVSDDIIRMLTHSQPYVRKKAVLAVHKVVLQYPEALAACLPRLADKLDDEDASVVAATVNVIGEFAQHAATDDLAPFVAMSPRLYSLLVSSTSNWTLIKLLKLFPLFTRYEPRLRAKLAPAVRDMFDNDVPSLMYESVSCFLNGGMVDSDDLELGLSIASKLRGLLAEADPNLKFVAFHSLAQLSALNPLFVAEGATRSQILSCLADSGLMADGAIRSKILRMLHTIVDDDNLSDITIELVDQLKCLLPDSGAGRDQSTELALAVVELCSAQNYDHLPNFSWYLDVLVELSTLARHQNAAQAIGAQLINVAVRVREARSEAVMASLRILDGTELEQVLISDAVWVVGEYGTELSELPGGGWPGIIRTILQSPSPAAASAVVKLISTYAKALVDWRASRPEILAILDEIESTLSRWSRSIEVELQERSCQSLELIRVSRDAVQDADMSGPSLLTRIIPSLFSGFDITPLAAGSQARIRPWPELDLDTPIPVDLGAEELSQADFESDSEGHQPNMQLESDQPVDAASGVESLQDPSANSVFYISSAADAAASIKTAFEEDESEPKKKNNMDSRLYKPIKKKVTVAVDESIGDPQELSVPPSGGRQVASDQPYFSMNEPLFKVGFRSQTSPELVTPVSSTAPSPPEPVVVRHKHKSKSSKVKSKSKAKSTKQKSTASPT